MSSKIYTLRADKQHPLKDVCARMKSEMDKKLGADLCADICRTENDSQIRMLAFECFYLRMGGFASLGILLIENNREQTADVVGYGGDSIIRGANKDLAKKAVQILGEMGFTVLQEKECVS